jgi:hypothetical protein
MTDPGGSTAEPVPTTLREFLEGVAPGLSTTVSDAAIYKSGRGGTDDYLERPTIRLFCNSEECEDVMHFDPVSNEQSVSSSLPSFLFVHYRCRHCQKAYKVFALRVRLKQEQKPEAELFKFGEDFPFGRPTPRKVLEILGSERDYYLKGRRAEFQGMGIAAFAYYRRVVENQKGSILAEFIRAAERSGAPVEMVTDLKAAAKETQFSKALDAIKHGVPPALLIDGHNPLFLLHNALSNGLHSEDDQYCLELAKSIRVVLFDVVDRITHVLKDHAELKSAVGKLMAVPRSASGEKGKSD